MNHYIRYSIELRGSCGRLPFFLYISVSAINGNPIFPPLDNVDISWK